MIKSSSWKGAALEAKVRLETVTGTGAYRTGGLGHIGQKCVFKRR